MNKIYKLQLIETPRLIIRPVQLGDEVELNRAINNSLELLQQWMPWASDPSLAATRDFVQRGVFARSFGSIVDFPMVVIHKQEQKIIGCSGYNEHSDPASGLYEIGYWCDINYQAKGYVTEYVNALTRYALKELKATTVLARIKLNNIKSIAVVERLNFVNQGNKPNIKVDNTIEYYFECNNIDDLPLLDISCCYEENSSSEGEITL